MFLKKVKIEGFQSHRSTILEFSSGITGIIGDSLSGKTAILRAIKWVVENRPGGFRFQSDFAKKDDATSAQLVFNDCKIKLAKTKNNSIYTIEEDDEIKTFRKFSAGIPDIIKDKINLGSINFQNQLDAHFLITSSGGKIAKAISHITQTDKIITWIQNITTDLSTLKTNEATLKKDIKKLDLQLAGFKGLQNFDKTISKIEKLQAKKEKIDDKHYKIENLLSQIEEAQKEIKKQKRYIRAKPYIEKIERLKQQLRTFEHQKEAITEALNIQEDIKERTATKKDIVKKYMKRIMENKLCPTCFSPITNKIILRIEKEMKI